MGLRSLPFVSEIGYGDRSRLVVNWADAGFAALGIVLTSAFSGIADVIAELWQAIIIDPVWALAVALDSVVGAVTTIPADTISTDAAETFASQTGYVGAILVVFVGAFVLAWTVQVIR